MKTEQKVKKATCNMCFKQMIKIDKWSVCLNPRCPNFALLQISVEKIGKWIKKK